MQPKINVQSVLIGTFAVVGGIVILKDFYDKISPYFSWGSNLCRICDLYECETYDYFCDDCADEVFEELRDKAEPNLEMYN